MKDKIHLKKTKPVVDLKHVKDETEKKVTSQAESKMKITLIPFHCGTQSNKSIEMIQIDLPIEMSRAISGDFNVDICKLRSFHSSQKIQIAHTDDSLHSQKVEVSSFQVHLQFKKMKLHLTLCPTHRCTLDQRRTVDHKILLN